ncbi:hypothetical protein [Nocardia sp. BMG51109]|nr:hypothetical protein [Nocardia sp. BMG51109]
MTEATTIPADVAQAAGAMGVGRSIAVFPQVFDTAGSGTVPPDLTAWL